MKTIATAVLAAASLAVASSALADQLEDMMKKYGCNACHAEDKTVIGP
jgi:cytochrome c551/c552